MSKKESKKQKAIGCAQPRNQVRGLARRISGIIMEIISSIPESSHEKSNKPKYRARELVSIATLHMYICQDSDSPGVT